MKQATIPKSYGTSPPTNYRHNAITISIKPLADIYLDGPPDHDELCCVVWQNGKRLIKFINRACPIHGKTQCLIEPAS